MQATHTLLNSRSDSLRRWSPRKLFAVSLIILAAVMHAHDSKAAETQFALTCIGTETGEKVNFEYRWGPSDEWQTTQVKPGVWQAISYRYRYPGENSAPRLELRFDDDLSSSVNMVRQKVDSYAARVKDCEGEGYTYNFIDRGGELFLHSDESRAGAAGL